MTTTLYARKTPKTTAKRWGFGQPVKGAFVKRFYDDNELSHGDMITLGDSHIDWLEGVLAMLNGNKNDQQDLYEIIELLRNGETIDIWIEG